MRFSGGLLLTAAEKERGVLPERRQNVIFLGRIFFRHIGPLEKFLNFFAKKSGNLAKYIGYIKDTKKLGKKIFDFFFLVIFSSFF